MQDKIDNSFQVENFVTEYENLIEGYSLNPERVTLYLPTENPNASTMTENELLQYINSPSNYQLRSAYTFRNHLEKNTIFLVLPLENPFSNDTIYFDFMTTYYSPGDTIVTSLQIYDKTPALLDYYFNGTLINLSKTANDIPIGAICTRMDDWTKLGILEARYYTVILNALITGFSGEKAIELLTDFLIDTIIRASGEPIEVILDLIKQMGYTEFIDYLYDMGAISEAVHDYLRSRSDWGSRIDRFQAWFTQYNAFSACVEQDVKFLRYLCMGYFGSYNSSYDLNWEEYCSNYQNACQSIYSLPGVQLFFFFTGSQRTSYCAECDSGLPRNTSNTSEDADSDGIENSLDNCPCTANDQADIDLDGIGDACDDSDGDGVVDAIDNCRLTFNPDQTDINENGIGDLCDAGFYNYNPDDCAQDTDGDGIVNCIDNCPTKPNPDQVDMDNDGVGDVCDNCPELFNISQKFAPCDIGDPEADQNCDQSEIDQEREQYDDYISDIFSCINNFGEGYDSRHVESELGGNAYSDPERVCLHSTIENRLGHDVLCAWWQNNPAWQLIGSSGVPVWGDYEAYCGDAGSVEMTPEIRNELNEIVICCKSEADIGQLIDIRNRIAQMLDCIPEDEPSFNCLNIKPQLGSLRDYYQLELDRMNGLVQITQDHISQYCTQ